MDTANSRDVVTGYAVCLLAAMIGLIDQRLPVDLLLAGAGLLGIAAVRRHYQAR